MLFRRWSILGSSLLPDAVIPEFVRNLFQAPKHDGNIVYQARRYHVGQQVDGCNYINNHPYNEQKFLPVVLLVSSPAYIEQVIFHAKQVILYLQ